MVTKANLLLFLLSAISRCLKENTRMWMHGIPKSGLVFLFVLFLILKSLLLSGWGEGSLSSHSLFTGTASWVLWLHHT